VLLLVSILLVAAGALAVRLPRLAQRPMHCDEANQAAKTGLLLEQGHYDYDPLDHHGPSLYWLTLPSLWLRSVSDFAASTEVDYRLVPVAFGAALVLLILLLADGLGAGPAILAGLLVAISPAMVFYSRYYIQETLLVFFTAAALGCGWRYYRRGRLGWGIATGASLGMMHATKETWVLAAAAALAAVLLLVVGKWGTGSVARVGLAPRETALPRCLSPFFATRFSPRTVFRPLLERLPLLAMLAALGTACLVAAAFYSSFGRQWNVPLKSVLAYANYWHRGSEAGIHAHPWYYYLQLLAAFHPARGFFWSEGLIVALALVGLGVSFTSHGLSAAQRTLGRFLGIYTLVLTILYSVIPYKTPWCLLSFLYGMILLAGLGAWAILRHGVSFWCRRPACCDDAGETPAPQPWAAVTRGLCLLVTLLMAAGAVHLAWECYVLNFRLDNDERNPYVYAQTSADAVKLGQQIERLSHFSADGHDMVIHVVTPENYWPLPWYLRQFNRHRHVGYWHGEADWWNETNRLPPPAVIILAPELQPSIDAHLRAAYNRQMIYGLRPGVLLSVYVREDLWQAASTDP
jgi:uncharacterized protein (TIGR03663 family)